MAARIMHSGAHARALARLWPGVRLQALPGRLPAARDAALVRLHIDGPHGALQIEVPHALFAFAPPMPLASGDSAPAADDDLPGLGDLLLRQGFGDWLRRRAAESAHPLWQDDAWQLRHIEWFAGPQALAPSEGWIRLHGPGVPAVELRVPHIDEGWRAALQVIAGADVPAFASLARLRARRRLALWRTRMPLHVLRGLRRGDGFLMPGTEARFDRWRGTAFLVIAGRRLCEFDAQLMDGHLTHMSNLKTHDPQAEDAWEERDFVDAGIDEEDEDPAGDSGLGDDDDDDDDDADADDTEPGLALDTLRLPLSVECDAGEMSLAEIGDLRRGFVLELPCTLKDAAVRIVVAGQALATGQLVAVADRLAVRIDRLNPNWDGHGGD